MSPKTKTPLADTSILILMGTIAPQFVSAYYQPLADRMVRRGYHHVMIKALPGFGLGHPADTTERIIAETLDEFPRERFIIIGHSQGALIASAIAHAFPGRIAGIFLLAGPLHGTQLARFMPRLGLSQAIEVMASHSEYLRSLRSRDVFPTSQQYSIYTVFDGLIWPWHSSVVSGAFNFVLAPKPMHRPLIRAGLTRSNGVELKSGSVHHLNLVRSPVTGRIIDERMRELEEQAA